LHLVHSQQGYLLLLTEPVEARRNPTPSFTELEESASRSGAGLLALARGEPSQPLETRLQTDDGYWVEPWVVMLQVINHATEHREQINSMLSALGVTPPNLDGWAYGEVTRALTPLSK
jgi:uncharacterized damage-inducible protein DinB